LRTKSSDWIGRSSAYEEMRVRGKKEVERKKFYFLLFCFGFGIGLFLVSTFKTGKEETSEVGKKSRINTSSKKVISFSDLKKKLFVFVLSDDVDLIEMTET
jgi:hypothetical protein